MSAELVNADTLPERMAALWHNISDPAVGNGRWITLEHELWSYAIRNPAALDRLTDRYRAAWAGLGELVSGDAETVHAGPSVLATLLGLEMVRRVGSAQITDAAAIAALCAVASSAPTEQSSSSTTRTDPTPGATS